MKNRLLKTLLLIVLLVLAIVLGLIIGDACAGVKGLSWLGASASFGIEPTVIDLAVVRFTFGVRFGINAAQAILLLLAVIACCTVRIRK